MMNMSSLDRVRGRRVVAFMLGSLGDTLITLPALRVLREAIGPAGTLDLLNNDQGDGRVQPKEVLANEGLIDEFLLYPSPFPRRPGSLIDITTALRRRRYEVAVCLLPSERPKRALLRDRLLFMLSGIHRTIGFSEVPGLADFVCRCESPSEAVFRLWRLSGQAPGFEEWASRIIADAYQLHPTAEELASAKGWLAARNLIDGVPLVGLAPGAKAPASRWPLTHFIRLAEKLIAICSARIVVVGGAHDADLVRAILAHIPTARSAAGELSVRESAALLSLLDLYVGNDTGTTHLAASVVTPTVALFSERAPEGQWRPLGGRCVVLRERVTCRCCRCEVCPVPGHPCLTGISPERAFEAALSLIPKSER